jgi:hypothetical protein
MCRLFLITHYGACFFQLNKMRHRPRMKSQLARIVATALECVALLVPGSVIFILAPAGIFCLIERNWTYLDSVYYAFITLTTIGLGDFVAGDVGCRFAVTNHQLSYLPPTLTRSRLESSRCSRRLGNRLRSLHLHLDFYWHGIYYTGRECNHKRSQNN